jgi:putative DNA primase/helicase
MTGSAATINGRRNTPATLLPQHGDELRKSGLSGEQIAACAFRTVYAKEAAELLGWKSAPTKMGPFLAIPFFAADGTPLDYVRLKPARPRQKNRKPVKYESPVGRPNRAYLPPRTRAALADPAFPLLLTEGEKKAAKADQDGFPCIGLVGVWGWQQARDRENPDAPRELVPDLAAVAWQGRVVFLVYDSDLADKREVAYAEWYLAEALKARGSAVKVVRLPPGAGGAKCGLDDYLVAQGPNALRRLLADAGPPQRPPGADIAGDKAIPPDEANDDPHRLARIYRGKQRVAEQLEGKTVWRDALIFWREEFLHWTAGAYQPLTDREVKAGVTACIKGEFDRQWRLKDRRRREKQERRHEGNGAADGDDEDKPPPQVQKVTAPLTRDVMQALASISLVPSTVDTPAWLGQDAPPWPPDEILVGRNGCVHLPSLIAGAAGLAPPTPRLFTRNALDYELDLDAPAPMAWLDFLRRLWPDDPQAVPALQEWFGYCLLPDTSQQKILMIVGPRRSGKGTIARVLRRLVGLANVCAPTLAGLGTNFGLWPLLGKTLAVISDARLSGRTDAAIVTERLLSISGEDAQTIDRKNLSQVTCKLSVRFVILTNELPRLNDASGALVGRLIVLRQTRSWYGEEDAGLTERLLAELPGILLWAIEGWRRLRERGRFVQPESGLQLVESMEDLASPIGEFVRERCEVGAGHEAPVKDLFAAWKAWCEEKGRKEPGTEASFGRDLRAAVPHLDHRRPRTDGGRLRVYVGIRLAAVEGMETPL